ncbi:hypothetical protein OUZ56_032090 [Daphnia magna]|uniref:Uncharacterized protein n=1 Tax=Daphnia magna TaxID=35525 RepID=A0ABQ9ZWG8_9CRUS|nr:hypothetical protein OUZ56_032090 [Daphnia magna]
MSDGRKRLTATIELPPNTVSAVTVLAGQNLEPWQISGVHFHNNSKLSSSCFSDSNIPAFTNLFDSVPTTTSSSTASHDSILTAPQSASSSHNLVSETVSRTPTNIQNTTENIFTETVQ